jgi:hypothetical protein
LQNRAADVILPLRLACCICSSSRSAGDIQTAAHIVLALGIDGLAACKISEHESMALLLE